MIKKKYSLIILTLIVVVGVFVVIQTEKNNTTLTQEEKRSDAIVKSEGVFKFGEEGLYVNLTDEEQQLVKSFHDAIYNKEFEYYEGQYDYELSNRYLKYYDDDIFIVTNLVPKPGIPLLIVNRTNFTTNNFHLNIQRAISGPESGYWEGGEHLISVQDKKIFYFKKGERSFKILEGSELSVENESYAKQVGMYNVYDFSVSTTTNTITLSVFDTKKTTDGYSYSPRIKIREVELPLP